MIPAIPSWSADRRVSTQCFVVLVLQTINTAACASGISTAAKRMRVWNVARCHLFGRVSRGSSFADGAAADRNAKAEAKPFAETEVKRAT
jgi:hypothetical protein